MATPTLNVSLTPELKAFVERRVRSGLGGNGSDVVRAGLRTLVREAAAGHYQRFQAFLAALQDPITPEVAEDIEHRIKAGRADEKRNKGR